MSAAPDLTRNQILTLLGSDGPLSRSDVAARLGIGAATTTEHVRRLLAAGFVRELSPLVTGAGRPRVPLQLIPDAAHVLGVRVAVDHLRTVRMRLDGKVVDSFRVPFDPADGPAAQICAAVTSALAARDGGQQNVRGVGVAVPGVVASDCGVIALSATLRWTDLPLGAELQSVLSLPVRVDNDLKASTIAELLFGIGRRRDDFLVLGLGDGVGLGIVLNRQVLRGAGGIGAEFGHIPMVAGGELCNCGNRGCLQTVVGANAIAEHAVMAGALESGAGLDEVVAAAEAGDAGVRGILAPAGEVLGRAVATVVNLLAVRAVKVIGESYVLWPYMEQSFVASCDAATIAPLRGLQLEAEAWDDSEHARGAACMMLADGALSRTRIDARSR